MKKEDDNDMAFLEHLEELRWRIVRALIVVLIFAVAIWFLKEWIIQHVFIAMSKPDFISFQLMCNYFGICIEEIPIRFQSNQVAAQFTYALYMCVVGGFIVAFPYVFYQFWSFIKPGLKAKEIQAARGITVSVSVLFLLGVGFGYFVVAPLCVNFFGDFQLAAEFENIWKIDSFMSMIISSVIFTGLLFLLPVVAYIFTKLGLITSVFLKKYRKHAIVGVLIVAAFITPPDFISQIIVAIPILILYEISILISRRVEPKYK